MRDENKTKAQLNEKLTQLHQRIAGLETAADSYQSPIRLVTIIALSVFVAEAVVMILLFFLPSFSTLSEALLDSALLVVFLSPILYYFLFRPLVLSITVRKRAEEALRESEEKYRSLIEQSNDAIYLLYENRFEIINPRFTELFGITPEEARAPDFDFMSLVAPKSRSLIEERRRKLAQGQELDPRYEFTAQDKEGNEIEVEVSVSYIPYRGGTATQGILRDVTARVRAEEALRESEAKMRSIFRAAPIGIGVVSNRVLLEVNDRLCEITAYSRDELIGKNARMVYPTDKDYEYVGREKYRQIQKRGTGTVETRFKCKDGKIIDVLLSSTPLDPTDLSAGVTFTALDITERVRAEEALRESEERFSLFMDHLPAVVFIKDENSRALYVNKYMNDVLGAKGWIGKTILELFPKDIAEAMIADDKKALAEGYQMIVETVPDKQGINHIYQTHKFRIECSGKPPLLGGIALDITERKRAEESLRLLSTAVETSVDAISVASPVDGKLLFCNDAFLKQWKVKGDYHRLSYPECFDADPSVLEEAVKATLEGGWSGELTAKAMDGQTFPVLTTASPVVDEEGKHVGMLGVFKDITERVRAEEERQRLYEQTRQDAETRSVLLREVNHRVKNNLTSILGLLYTARNRVRMDDRATYLATMDDLIGRVRGLATAHDLLSASGWAPLRLSDLATRVIHVSLEALPRHKRVSVNVLSSSVHVTPDQAHNLALVLGELTANTAKHALEGRDTARITFQITLDDRDSMVRCEFRDDGPGYPEDVLRLERCKVGFDLIQNIVRKGLRGELTLHNDRGAVAVIRFEAQVREQ